MLVDIGSWRFGGLVENQIEATLLDREKTDAIFCRKVVDQSRDAVGRRPAIVRYVGLTHRIDRCFTSKYPQQHFFVGDAIPGELFA